jgi:hypothetical protein
MVVFVTRQDLHRKRAKKWQELETQNVLKNTPAEKQEKANQALANVLRKSNAVFVF